MFERRLDDPAVKAVSVVKLAGNGGTNEGSTGGHICRLFDEAGSLLSKSLKFLARLKRIALMFAPS